MHLHSDRVGKISAADLFCGTNKAADISQPLQLFAVDVIGTETLRARKILCCPRTLFMPWEHLRSALSLTKLSWSCMSCDEIRTMLVFCATNLCEIGPHIMFISIPVCEQGVIYSIFISLTESTTSFNSTNFYFLLNKSEITIHGYLFYSFTLSPMSLLWN